MKTESVYPEHREEWARDEVLVLIDDYIHWYNPARIKRSFGWMSPVECRQKTKEGLRDCLQENVRSTFFHAECGGEFDDPGIGEPLGVFGVERPPSCKGNSCGNAVVESTCVSASCRPGILQLHHGMCQAPTLPLHFRTFYERVRMTVENSTSTNMVDSRSFPLHGEMRVNFCPRCRLLSRRAVLRCRHKACLL